MAQTFRILSLSGGGYLGLYTAQILAGIEERCGRPLRDHFDLVAGTSIGGILALSIAAGLPMKEVSACFVEHGQAIFSPRPGPEGYVSFFKDVMRFVRHSKYDGRALRQTCLTLFGKRHTLSDLPIRVICPAANLTTGKPEIFRTPHLADRHHAQTRLVDVALATSAAPALLPLHKIGENYFADGGIFANAPDLIAIDEAEHRMGIPLSAIDMLAIGTTMTDYGLRAPRQAAFGLKDWLEGQRIVKVTIAMQQQLATESVSTRLGPRYLRLDRDQKPQDIPHLGLDIATRRATDILSRMAKDTLAEAPWTEIDRRFLAADDPSQGRRHFAPLSPLIKEITL